jgi:uncharacterized membrane protein YhaH (DUF805 family)
LPGKGNKKRGGTRMKISRSSYPMMFALFLLVFVFQTIGQFSTELQKKLFLPILTISIILVIIGIFLAIKDKELLHMITDERTKKVDRSAGYYSWWCTLFFVCVAGFGAEILGFSVRQLTFLIFSELFLSLLLFHMYFNLKGKF